VSAYTGSFGNCQNFTVNSFRELETYKDIETFLTFVARETGRYYAVIDINFHVYRWLDKELKEKNSDISFVIAQPYTNANDSDMVMCILDLIKFRPDDE
jgi:hypothetical protein